MLIIIAIYNKNKRTITSNAKSSLSDKPGNNFITEQFIYTFDDNLIKIIKSVNSKFTIKNRSLINGKTIIETRNKPTRLPPQPFLNFGVKTRLIYERLRALKDI